METKKCAHCKEEKPLSEFSKRSRLRGGINYNCRKCALQQGKESKYRTRYGLELEEKEKMVFLQNEKCVICGDDISGERKAVVDHDHNTNVVRAILCQSCNKGLGCFRDDPEILEKAKAYLLLFTHRGLGVPVDKLEIT